MAERQLFHLKDCAVQVGHLTSFHRDYLCIFKVASDGVATIYVRHIDKDIATELTGKRLATYLIDDLRHATALWSFKDA